MDDKTFRQAVVDALAKHSEPPMPNTEKLMLEERVKGIEKVTKAAKANWFWFFGILGYVTLTVIGLDAAALFSPTATATLPILNFSVSLRSFSVLLPGLIAIFYIYLHGQIELMWNDLSALPDQVKGPGDDPKTYPVIKELPVWLLIEFTLLIRDWRHSKANGTGAVQPSSIGVISALVMGALIWLAAPLILLWLWWQTLVLQETWLSFWQVFCFLCCVAGGWMSWKQMYEEMGETHEN